LILSRCWRWQMGVWHLLGKVVNSINRLRVRLQMPKRLLKRSRLLLKKWVASLGSSRRKSQPTATPVAPKAKKAEAEIWDEGRVVADLAANLSQFFRVQQQLADHIREEEEKSKSVYDPNQNIMESALNRELAKTQFEKLAKEIREIMVYQSPPELGNLYTRVNQMRVIIIAEQEEARLAQEKKQRDIEWQRRKVISAIQDKAIYGVACLVFVLYLVLFFSLLIMDRKVRWGF